MKKSKSTSKKLRMASLIALQEGVCFYCGCPFYSGPWKAPTIDHFYPLSRKDVRSRIPLTYNKVAACSVCNFRKGNKLPTSEQRVRFHAFIEQRKMFHDEIFWLKEAEEA